MQLQKKYRVRVMMFNTTFNSISLKKKYSESCLNQTYLGPTFVFGIDNDLLNWDFK